MNRLLIRDMPPYVEAYPNENLTTLCLNNIVIRCPSKRVSSVCGRVNRRCLRDAGGGNCRTSRGPVVLIAPDMQNALRLHDETASSPIRW